jgi:hypothetical protein
MEVMTRQHFHTTSALPHQIQAIVFVIKKSGRMMHFSVKEEGEVLKAFVSLSTKFSSHKITKY